MILLGDEGGSWALYGPEGEASPYRYGLGRPVVEGDLFRCTPRRRVTFCMLNPSTADHRANDATVRRCLGYARSWGFDELVVVNLFAWRSTDKSVLPKVADPVGPENDSALVLLARPSVFVVCAWGNDGTLNGRDQHVMQLLRNAGCDLRALHFTKEGNPSHPLYLDGALQPISWEGRAA